MPDGKARFAPVAAGRVSRAPGEFAVSTRRGKQFNSMVQREVDPLTGGRREDVFISGDDLRALRLPEGAAVRLRSANGTFDGRLKVAPIKPGNLEVHWPEGTVLLSGAAIDPDSMEPDYNAVVTIERSS
jgi:anaerobic selenocysteine-containing dehydrogenase